MHAYGIDAPRNVRIGVQDGTFQSLILPAQLPVAKIALFGEKRTCDIGRSSPIWEPRFAKACRYRLRCSQEVICEGENTRLYISKHLLAYVEDATERHLAIYALLGDSFLSSEKDRITEEVVST